MYYIINVKIRWAEIPAHKPPIVCDNIALLVSSLASNASIIPTCVLKYPLQHIPIAVNTAISLGPIIPSVINWGTKDIAAPTAPKDVIGNAIASWDVNPNKGSNMKLIFSPISGSNPMAKEESGRG